MSKGCQMSRLHLKSWYGGGKGANCPWASNGAYRVKSFSNEINQIL